jgi:hypothetical protein
VIVVDQFGYPTKASKIAVARDPQTGYDNAVHFTPGTTYAVVDKSTGKIVKRVRQLLGMVAPQTTSQATKSGGLISPMLRFQELTQSWILRRDSVPSNSRSGQDPQIRPWRGKRGLISGLIKSDVSQIKDLHGGGFDAGAG